MKIKYQLITFSLSLLIFISCKNSAEPDQANYLREPYFGIPFPTLTITRFASDIFTEGLHDSPVFTPDGSEVYWSLMDSNPSNIQHMKIEPNGAWSDPSVTSFSFPEGSTSPSISFDGNILLFLSRHNTTNGKNIWIMEKNNDQWESPIMLGDEVNQFEPHWQVSIAENQNLYFGGRFQETENAGGSIYCSEFINNNYTTAYKLNQNINTINGYEATPFIAPDESYIIFARIRGNSNNSDLYISFKQNDNSWGNSINMASLNTDYHEACAIVSQNGRFFMFLSDRTGVMLPYWIDAQIIENYRP